ncbi:DNA repair protein rhp57 [Marasmius crinis-equi]|uniref:DNA repair protein rhp57 n=1 Tax=Marasmius crinis-equi TaxID=585013 RepID=A0ABR3ETD0_9AGAR
MISTCSALSSSHKQILRRGNVNTISDLVFTPVADLARRCRAPPLEIKGIVDTFYRSQQAQARSLEECLAASPTGICTTGDELLDNAVGGGIRSGMVWEVVGESSAGKTQFALQLSLCVQLPEELGGLSGSSCYMITSAHLPTERLVEISENHRLLASSSSGLHDIHTMSIPTIPVLISALQHALPRFIEGTNARPDAKPVKLLVIDALGELFHTSHKTSTNTLVERSKNIAEISQLLHTIADAYNIIILVLNEVVDAFERETSFDGIENLGLPYAEQSRWFSQSDGLAGEAKKEASLGLVWANQVNVRIMLSRTGRRRYIEGQFTEKRQKVQSSNSAEGRPVRLGEDSSSLIRRLSIIFSSIGPPTFLDYIVTASGISTLPTESARPSQAATAKPLSHASAEPSPEPALTQIVPLDIGALQGDLPSSDPHIGNATTSKDEEDWDEYWNTDEITAEMYYSVEQSSAS